MWYVDQREHLHNLSNRMWCFGVVNVLVEYCAYIDTNAKQVQQIGKAIRYDTRSPIAHRARLKLAAQHVCSSRGAPRPLPARAVLFCPQGKHRIRRPAPKPSTMSGGWRQHLLIGQRRSRRQSWKLSGIAPLTAGWLRSPPPTCSREVEVSS